MFKNLRFLLAMLLLVNASTYAQNVIKVRLAPEFKGPYTGRLVVYTMQDTTKKFGQSNEDEPAFSIDVKNWKNGEDRVITAAAYSFVKNVSQLGNGYYKLIAILDTNMSERGTSAPGNLYTKLEKVWKATGNKEDAAVLTLTDTFKPPVFKENDSLKQVLFKSDLLSKFHGKSIFMKAGVVLPASYYRNATRIYPVVYIIPGWGGTHYNAQSTAQRAGYGIGMGQEKIYVFLNPDTQSPFGLHAFVDSRVNGPWGEALVKELMPYMSRQYRTSTNPNLNFITGQSTGGYGTVWLLLNYPAYFGGAWATSPDPVDFSDFTDVNIYTDQNFYTNADGTDKGMYKVKGVYLTTLRRFKEKEEVEGDGGQFQAFEAEFGLFGKDKKPVRLFDPKTGIIDHAVAASWKPYDMALYVQQHWAKIKDKAAGKLRIYAGTDDNFYLNQSVEAFAAKIKTVNADIHVEIIPGADHFTVRSPALTKKIQAEMDDIIKRNQ